MANFITQSRKWYRTQIVERNEHLAVVRAIAAEGQLNGRFAFMTLISGAIAVLGLLLSSPAVVIGAMLISPLMGPIMSLGFALCILDLQMLKDSLATMACGILLALAIAYGIVYCSPITDATPEIIARTQPNLFDLLVAIFSGLAGGYAAIKRKGETIVGVAIATALMPPLAVVGYGLATNQWSVATGAAFLFMTNLLAISLTVTFLAKCYGFGKRHGAYHTIWQTVLILGVFGALSLPLGLALKNIAYKGYITKTTQAILNEDAVANHARIDQFSIAFPVGQPVQVHAMLLTKRYLPDTDTQLAQEMTEKLGRPIQLEIDQIIVAQAQVPKKEGQIELSSNPLAAPAVAPISGGVVSTDALIVAYAKDALGLPVKAQRLNGDKKYLTLIIGNERPIGRQALRKAEQDLADHFPSWTVKLIPEQAADALPLITQP